MKKFLLLVFYFLFPAILFAQEPETDSLELNYEFSFDLGFYHSLYGNYNYGYYGYQITDNYVVTSMLFSNGVRLKNRLYFGMALGSEYIHTQTIPLLADLKYDFLRNSLSPFLYARVGGAFALNTKENNTDYYSIDWRGGLIGTWGLGIKKTFKNNTALSFSLGYRYQKLSQETKYTSGTVELEKTDYSINRVVVRSSFYFK